MLRISQCASLHISFPASVSVDILSRPPCLGLPLCSHLLPSCPSAMPPPPLRPLSSPGFCRPLPASGPHRTPTPRGPGRRARRAAGRGWGARGAPGPRWPGTQVLRDAGRGVSLPLGSASGAPSRPHPAEAGAALGPRCPGRRTRPPHAHPSPGSCAAARSAPPTHEKIK